MLRLERHAAKPTGLEPRLSEIITPRTNTAAPRPAEPLFATLVGSIGVSLELAELPLGWRALVQLVLRPAPADWARPHLRRSLEHALAPERAAESGGRSSGWGGLVGAVVLLGAVVLGPRLALASRSGDWPHLI